MRFRFGVWISFLALTALLVSRTAFGAKTKVDTPTISCGTSTQAGIDIQVCAGASGAPAGFSVQWITLGAFNLGPDGIAGTADDGTWPASDSSSLCKASFSGNANPSRYNLGANECVSVRVGDFLFDEGASTNCADSLVCGTTYVFRSFAHATNTLQRSDFTANRQCSTLPCNDDTTGCTLTQGYWKTHGPIPVGANSYTWPQSVQDNGLTLGNISYTADQLLSILNTPASGNGLLALAHQLIAAKLNIANGSDGSAIAADIAAADALIGNLIIPPIGSDYLAPGSTSALTTALSNYNEGGTGPGHCP